jgi:hypothetical protein
MDSAKTQRRKGKPKPDMVDHDRKRKAIYAEVCREFLETILNPSSAVFKGFSRERILSAQPCTTDRPLDTMKNHNFVRTKDISTIHPGHDEHLLAKERR